MSTPPDHEDLQGDIPAFLADRLDGEPRRRIERHLAGCADCADLAGSWRTIAAALRAGGEAIFSAHPPPLELRAIALAPGEGSDPDAIRHVASCPSCELEVMVWRRREGRLDEAPAPASFERPHSALSSWRPEARIAGALVAGLIIGFSLSALVRRPVSPDGEDATRIARGTGEPVTTPEGNTGGAASGGRNPAAAEGGAIEDLKGPVPLWVLAGPLRGETPVASFVVSGRQPYVFIAARPVIAPGAGEEERFRFEIRRAGAEVWESEASAAQIRSDLRSAGVVTLPVPSTVLVPGRYEFVFSAAAPATAPALLRIAFTISAAS